MNAGFFPEEGKYNRTACVRCFTQYPLEEAVRHGWRCPADGGIIKKGVSDRAKELARGRSPSPVHPMSMSSRSPRSSRRWKDIVAEHEEMQSDLCVSHQRIRERDRGPDRCAGGGDPCSPPEGRGRDLRPAERDGHPAPGRGREIRHVLAWMRYRDAGGGIRILS